MSRGSPIVKLRIKQDRLDLMLREIDRVNDRRKDEPYTVSSFILAAIEDKLAHLARSRKSGKKTAEIPFNPARPPLHYEP